MNASSVSSAEADAASLRRAFVTAVETYPARLAGFLTKEGEKAFREWWGAFYAAVRDHTAGLRLLAELQRAKELDELRRLELADMDATLADMETRYRELKERLARWQAEKGEVASHA